MVTAISCHVFSKYKNYSLYRISFFSVIDEVPIIVTGNVALVFGVAAALISLHLWPAD